MPIIFQGHLIFPWGMSWDLTVTFLPIIIFLILRRFKILPKIGWKMNLWDYSRVLFFVIWAPNTAYEMFEVRHLLLIDGVSDNPDVWSYVVFVSISLLGFLIATHLGRLIIDYYSASPKERKLYAFFLSLDYGIGVPLGLLGLNSYDLINLSKFYDVLINVPARPELMALSVIIILFFFVLQLLLDRFYKPPF